MNKYQIKKKYERIGQWGNIKKYRCLLCGHTIKTYNGLRTHIRRKHPKTKTSQT